MEKITKFKKSQGRMMRKGKHGAAMAVSPHAWHEEASKWKREIIEGRKKNRSRSKDEVENNDEAEKSEKAKGKEKAQDEDDDAFGRVMDETERVSGGQLETKGLGKTALEEADWEVPEAEQGHDVASGGSGSGTGCNEKSESHQAGG